MQTDTVYVKDLVMFLTMRIRQQLYRSESFAMNTDTHVNGSTVKNHISLKTGFGYSATRRTSFRSWFQACHRVLLPVLIIQPQWHLQYRRVIILHLPHARLLHQLQQYQATRRLEKGKGRFSSSACVKWTCWKERTGRPGSQPTKNPKPNKDENHDIERSSFCSEILDLLQEFRKISWMKEFPNAEIHIPVLLMNHL